MNFIKSHFWYNNGQRNGILFLATAIIALQFFYFFTDYKNDKPNVNNVEIIAVQKEIDSLKQIELENRQPKIYPFNPSFLTDYRGYQFGMNIEEIDRLLEHREKGKYINSAKEFQQVTGISDSLLAVMEPYFKFPEWVIERQNKKVTNSNLRILKDDIANIPIQDINEASIEDFKSISGVGDKLAQRIIKYRTMLGGFLINEQLYEVYYLDKPVGDRLLKRFQVLNPPKIRKINVNTASFKEVLSIVYIDYELCKKIFNYRDEVAEIQSLEELKKIEGFPLDKFDRIALYLEAE